MINKKRFMADQFKFFLDNLGLLDEFAENYEKYSLQQGRRMFLFINEADPCVFVTAAFDWTSTGEKEKWLSVCLAWNHYVRVSI